MCSYFENEVSRKTKINNSWTTCALFSVNGVSIDPIKMDYKRLSFKQLARSAGATKRFETSYNGEAMKGD